MNIFDIIASLRIVTWYERESKMKKFYPKYMISDLQYSLYEKSLFALNGQANLLIMIPYYTKS